MIRTYLITLLLIGLAVCDTNTTYTPHDPDLSIKPTEPKTCLSNSISPLCFRPKGFGIELVINDLGFAITVSHGGHAVFGYISLFGFMALWTVLQMIVRDLVLHVWQQEMGF